MDVLSNALDLSFWANIGSVFGALATLIAFIQQRKTRRHYKLLIQGPEQLEALRKVGAKLNLYDELSPGKRKTVLATARSHLHNTGKLLGWKEWVGLGLLRLSLRWQWKKASAEYAETLYAEVQRLIVHVEYQIREKKVEQ